MVSNYSLLTNCQTHFQYLFSLISGRQPQVISGFNANPNVKSAWRVFARVFQHNSWMWQVFIFGLAFTMYYAIYTPFVAIYQSNNKHRTYEAAIAKEKAHKKKLR